MLKKILAATTAFIYFSVHVVLGHAVETGFWVERRKALGQRADLLASAPVLARPVGGALSGLGAFSRERGMFSTQLPSAFQKIHGETLGALPTEQGSLRNLALPPRGTGPLVIHIQDVHGNLAAQRRIAEAVAALAPRAGVVGVEGSSRKLDLSRFRSFSDGAAVNLAAEELFLQGEITGPVRAALTAQGAFPPLVGLEDAALYNAHATAYRDSRSGVEIERRRLASEKAALDQIKNKVLSPGFRAFHEGVTLYHEGGALAPYLALIRAGATDLPEDVRRFDQALGLEQSLDFQTVEAERRRAAEQLAGRMDAGELARWAALGTAYRLGKIRYGAFYDALRGLCQRKGVAVGPALDAYIRYALLADGVDAEKLFQGMGRLEKEAYGRWARNPEERAFVVRARRWVLEKKLVEFSLTPEEWREYAALPERRPTLSSFERFYQEADARDRVLAQNLLAALPKEDNAVAVLVTGGYHAPGIARILNEGGAAVVSFVPKIEAIDTAAGAAALGVFAREKTPLQKLFQGEKLFLGKDPLPREVESLALPAHVAATTAEPTSTLRALLPPSVYSKIASVRSSPGNLFLRFKTNAYSVRKALEAPPGHRLVAGVVPATGFGAFWSSPVQAALENPEWTSGLLTVLPLEWGLLGGLIWMALGIKGEGGPPPGMAVPSSSQNGTGDFIQRRVDALRAARVEIESESLPLALFVANILRKETGMINPNQTKIAVTGSYVYSQTFNDVDLVVFLSGGQAGQYYNSLHFPKILKLDGKEIDLSVSIIGMEIEGHNARMQRIRWSAMSQSLWGELSLPVPEKVDLYMAAEEMWAGALATFPANPEKLVSRFIAVGQLLSSVDSSFVGQTLSGFETKKSTVNWKKYNDAFKAVEGLRAEADRMFLSAWNTFSPEDRLKIFQERRMGILELAERTRRIITTLETAPNQISFSIKIEIERFFQKLSYLAALEGLLVENPSQREEALSWVKIFDYSGLQNSDTVYAGKSILQSLKKYLEKHPSLSILKSTGINGALFNADLVEKRMKALETAQVVTPEGKSHNLLQFLQGRVKEYFHLEALDPDQFEIRVTGSYLWSEIFNDIDFLVVFRGESKNVEEIISNEISGFRIQWGDSSSLVPFDVLAIGTDSNSMAHRAQFLRMVHRGKNLWGNIGIKDPSRGELFFAAQELLLWANQYMSEDLTVFLSRQIAVVEVLREISPDLSEGMLRSLNALKQRNDLGAAQLKWSKLRIFGLFQSVWKRLSADEKADRSRLSQDAVDELLKTSQRTIQLLQIPIDPEKTIERQFALNMFLLFALSSLAFEARLKGLNKKHLIIPLYRELRKFDLALAMDPPTFLKENKSHFQNLLRLAREIFYQPFNGTSRFIEGLVWGGVLAGLVLWGDVTGFFGGDPFLFGVGVLGTLYIGVQAILNLTEALLAFLGQGLARRLYKDPGSIDQELFSNAEKYLGGASGSVKLLKASDMAAKALAAGLKTPGTLGLTHPEGTETYLADWLFYEIPRWEAGPSLNTGSRGPPFWERMVWRFFQEIQAGARRAVVEREKERRSPRAWRRTGLSLSFFRPFRIFSSPFSFVSQKTPPTPGPAETISSAPELNLTDVLNKSLTDVEKQRLYQRVAALTDAEVLDPTEANKGPTPLKEFILAWARQELGHSLTLDDVQIRLMGSYLYSHYYSDIDFVVFVKGREGLFKSLPENILLKIPKGPAIPLGVHLMGESEGEPQLGMARTAMFLQSVYLWGSLPLVDPNPVERHMALEGLFALAEVNPQLDSKNGVSRMMGALRFVATAEDPKTRSLLDRLEKAKANGELTAGLSWEVLERIRLFAKKSFGDLSEEGQERVRSNRKILTDGFKQTERNVKGFIRKHESQIDLNSPTSVEFLTRVRFLAEFWGTLDSELEKPPQWMLFLPQYRSAYFLAVFGFLILTTGILWSQIQNSRLSSHPYFERMGPKILHVKPVFHALEGVLTRFHDKSVDFSELQRAFDQGGLSESLVSEFISAFRAGQKSLLNDWQLRAALQELNRSFFIPQGYLIKIDPHFALGLYRAQDITKADNGAPGLPVYLIQYLFGSAKFNPAKVPDIEKFPDRIEIKVEESVVASRDDSSTDRPGSWISPGFFWRGMPLGRWYARFLAGGVETAGVLWGTSEVLKFLLPLFGFVDSLALALTLSLLTGFLARWTFFLFHIPQNPMALLSPWVRLLGRATLAAGFLAGGAVLLPGVGDRVFLGAALTLSLLHTWGNWQKTSHIPPFWKKVLSKEELREMEGKIQQLHLARVVNDEGEEIPFMDFVLKRVRYGLGGKELNPAEVEIRLMGSYLYSPHFQDVDVWVSHRGGMVEFPLHSSEDFAEKLVFPDQTEVPFEVLFLSEDSKQSHSRSLAAFSGIRLWGNEGSSWGTELDVFYWIEEMYIWLEAATTLNEVFGTRTAKEFNRGILLGYFLYSIWPDPRIKEKIHELKKAAESPDSISMAEWREVNLYFGGTLRKIWKTFSWWRKAELLKKNHEKIGSLVGEEGQISEEDEVLLPAWFLLTHLLGDILPTKDRERLLDFARDGGVDSHMMAWEPLPKAGFSFPRNSLLLTIAVVCISAASISYLRDYAASLAFSNEAQKLAPSEENVAPFFTSLEAFVVLSKEWNALSYSRFMENGIKMKFSPVEIQTIAMSLRRPGEVQNALSLINGRLLKIGYLVSAQFPDPGSPVELGLYRVLGEVGDSEKPLTVRFLKGTPGYSPSSPALPSSEQRVENRKDFPGALGSWVNPSWFWRGMPLGRWYAQFLAAGVETAGLLWGTSEVLKFILPLLGFVDPVGMGLALSLGTGLLAWGIFTSFHVPFHRAALMSPWVRRLGRATWTVGLLAGGMVLWPGLGDLAFGAGAAALTAHHALENHRTTAAEKSNVVAQKRAVEQVLASWPYAGAMGLPALDQNGLAGLRALKTDLASEPGRETFRGMFLSRGGVSSPLPLPLLWGLLAHRYLGGVEERAVPLHILGEGDKETIRRIVLGLSQNPEETVPLVLAGDTPAMVSFLRALAEGRAFVSVVPRPVAPEGALDVSALRAGLAALGGSAVSTWSIFLSQGIAFSPDALGILGASPLDQSLRAALARLLEGEIPRPLDFQTLLDVARLIQENA